MDMHKVTVDRLFPKPRADRRKDRVLRENTAALLRAIDPQAAAYFLAWTRVR